MPKLNETEFRDALLSLARLLVEHSGGRLRLAFKEENDSTKSCDDVAHFLKVDEKRVGRDIELYGFLAKIGGQEMSLTMILEEIVWPLKNLGLSEVYGIAAEKLRELGRSVFNDEVLAEWCALV